MNIEICRSIIFYLKMLRDELKYKSPDKYEREKYYEQITFLIEILQEYIENYSNLVNKYYDHIT